MVIGLPRDGVFARDADYVNPLLEALESQPAAAAHRPRLVEVQ